MDYAIIISNRREKGDIWTEVIDGLEKKGIKVFNEQKDVGTSIVLSGLYTNPTALKGKKVMILNPAEWMAPTPPPFGYAPFGKVLEEYYDEIINVMGLKPKYIVKKILEYINENETNKP